MVNGIPKLAGEYKLLYSHDILGGCVGLDSISVYVNGISGSIVLDTFSGCAPLEVNPQANIRYNFNFGTDKDSIEYAWNVFPISGAVLTGIEKDTPKFVLSGERDYTIQLSLRNAAGCTNFAISDTIFVGVKADFNIKDDILCFGDSLIVENLSSEKAEISEWQISPNFSSVENKLNNKEYSFSLPNDGDFTITQIVNRDGVCYDTLTKSFKVVEVISLFESTDTFLTCAPVYAQFQSFSKNADSLFWDFGDGAKAVTKSSSAGHIYKKNSGWGVGFNIRLIAQSKYGCADTSVKDNYLVVQGPVPLIEPNYTIGCEPLNVSFTNKSKDAVESILNYNDGSSLDYSKIPDYVFQHTFKGSKDSSITYFTIDLLTYDSLGCAATYSIPTPIRVRKSPKIVLEQSATNNSCVPFNLRLSDISKTAITWQWQVETLSDYTDSVININFTDYGEFETQVITTNDSGVTLKTWGLGKQFG